MALIPRFAFCQMPENCKIEMDCCDHEQVNHAEISNLPCCDENTAPLQSRPTISTQLQSENKNNSIFTSWFLTNFANDYFRPYLISKRSNLNRNVPQKSSIQALKLPLLC